MNTGGASQDVSDLRARRAAGGRRTEPSPQSTRARVLRAGLKVIESRGYSNASVREVCALAGISKPTLYYHFGSRQGLVRAILADAASRLAGTVEEALTVEGLVVYRITHLCERLAEFLAQEPAARVVLEAWYVSRGEDLPTFDVTVFERTLDEAFGRLLAEGRATGEFSDDLPEGANVLLVGVVIAESLRLQGRRGDGDPKSSVQSLLQIALRGLLPPIRGRQALVMGTIGEPDAVQRAEPCQTGL